MKAGIKKLRKLNLVTHRDLGYFFSSLIIIYCISGIALNHVNDWNPDFVITRNKVSVPGSYNTKTLKPETILQLSALANETKYKVFDCPTGDQVKIYYDNASLHVNFSNHEAIYEKVSRRPVFYQANVFHKNSFTGWKWASDVLAVMLILISVTGLFILKGKHGISGRGKWLILAGTLPPLIVLILHEFI